MTSECLLCIWRAKRRFAKSGQEQAVTKRKRARAEQVQGKR